MGLQKYYKKRNFRQTPEPRGRLAKKGSPHLKFVVQEHHASTLHYDFRLEMQGVLRSWAIPKGPSTDPAVKRLAVEVEDHPMEYRKFEGVIPKDQYGAGRVIRWDSGEWEPHGDPVQAFKKGRIDFTLHGDRLHGRWVLVRTRRRQGKHSQWLLIKRHDSAANEKVKTLDHSVRLPSKIEPQLCQLVRHAPEGDEWLHEIKFDGYRLICRVDTPGAQFYTRQGLNWTKKFEGLKSAVEAIGLKHTILDGEVVCLNDSGVSDFSCLQETLSADNTKQNRKLIYYVFDLLFLNGNDLRERPLEERKELLATILKDHPSKDLVRFSEHIVGQGRKFFAQSCHAGLEGIISKQRDSRYSSGRSDDWVKTKCETRQEFVIGGYTDPQGSREGFGALLLGLNERGKLRYVGKTGTGFNGKSLQSLLKKFKKHETKKSPFANLERAPRVHWLKPELVAEIKFAGFTSSGSVRHGAFVGLREDKPAKSVKPDRPIKAVESVRPKLTHPEKILFSDTGMTKQDVVDYYTAIAKWILPHIENRPLTLLRCPGGSKKTCFFQRHAESKPSEWIHVDSLNGLLSLIQMGSLELHVWNSKVEDLSHPDTIVFDLDPDVGLGWSAVVEAALELRVILKGLGLKSFVKVTGGKGLHIQVPIQPHFEWEKIKNFSHSVAKLLIERHPGKYTDNMRKPARKGKIFIDYLRNGYSSTAVAAYSLRNRPGTPVALPVDWKELNTRLKPDSFTVKKTLQRLKAGKDPWKDYFKTIQTIEVLK